LNQKGRDGEEAENEAHQGEIASGPVDAEPFSRPEHAEGRQQNADAELQRVLRHAREGAVQEEPGAKYQRKGRSGFSASQLFRYKVIE
jgi:hypothetical protein